MRNITLFIFCLLCSITNISATVVFDKWFNDSTLRLDYVFSGNINQQLIALNEMSSSAFWYGRRVNLDSLLYRGNGQITINDKASGHVLYKQAFSCLFQEWVSGKEAKKVTRSFQNCFLVPYPKKNAIIKVILFNSYQTPVATLTHEFNPQNILIQHKQNKAKYEYKYVLKSGDPKDCIDIAVVAEGYTKEEFDKFYIDAKRTRKALMASKPFKKYKDRFNIVAVALPSKVSGVSIPSKNSWKESALGSHFSTFYSDRYLTTLHLFSLHNALTGIPYEHIIILANTDYYGGGGIFNSYALTTTHNANFKKVVVHEFGHSFAGLADEYYYDDNVFDLYHKNLEPWEANITTLVDFESKWKDMVDPSVSIPTKADGKKIYDNIGVYEGGGYSSKGIYRPCQDCRMKTNNAPDFCPVCTRAIERMIRFYTRE